MLSEIVPVPGVQQYLLDHWIEQSDIEAVKNEDGELDCYHDGTYDWYAGFSRLVSYGHVLEIGVYRGYSMAAIQGQRQRPLLSDMYDAVLVDSEEGAGPGSLSLVSERLQRVYWGSTFFRPFVLNTQSDEWQLVPKLKYSLIHIDADHSYQGCYRDLKNFSPMLAENGLLIVHDTKTNRDVVAAVSAFLAAHKEFDWREIPTVCGNIVMQRAPSAA